MNRVVLKAEDLDGFLTEADRTHLANMDGVYQEALGLFDILGKTSSVAERKQAEESLIALYNNMGLMMQEICQEGEGIQVYSFLTPHESHAEASRLIAKLRDVRTENQEFVYYSQRAYEISLS
jgi:uracil phosphoribosyltransferase